MTSCMRRRYTAEQRERLLREVRDTGERVSVVAARLGITNSAAYLWMKEARSSSASPPAFARVVREIVAKRGLVVEIGAATIRVDAGFDAELLRNLVAALSEQT